MKVMKVVLFVVMIVLFGRLLLYLIAPPRIEMVFAKGDTIHEFSQLLGVSPRYLLYYNNIRNPRTIPVGTKIRAPMPVLPYLRFRFGFDKLAATSSQPGSESHKPLVYDPGRAVSGTIFYGPDVQPHPNPKIFCGKHMILGHFFLAYPQHLIDFPYPQQEFDFIVDGNKPKLYELAGDNPVLCPVILQEQNKYMLEEALLPQFISIWNSYRLQNKYIVFYKGDL